MVHNKTPFKLNDLNPNGLHTLYAGTPTHLVVEVLQLIVINKQQSYPMLLNPSSESTKQA
jgi:hypothetical protein